MPDIVLNIITAPLDISVYYDIIAGVREELEDDHSEGVSGVVELNYGVFDVVFWFCAFRSNSGEISLDRWMLLTFCNGIRCSNDFDISRLISLL